MQKKDLKYWIAGAIFVIIVIGATFPYMIAKSRINSLKDQLRKEGEPVNLREYAAKYYKPVPDEENGVATFDDAYSQHVDSSNSNRLIIAGTAVGPRFDQKISPLFLPYAREYVKDNKNLCDAMSEMKKYVYLRSNYNWDDGFMIKLDRLNKFRTVDRLYAVKVELLIQEKKSEQAAATLTEMFHMNKLLSQNPFLIGQLVFYGCEGIALSSLERSMSALTFTPAQLMRLQDICVEHQKIVTKNSHNMWKMEICMSSARSDFKMIEMMGIDPYRSTKYLKEVPTELRMAYYYYSGVFINDLYSYCNAARKIKDIPVDVFSIRKPELDKIDIECRDNHSGFFYNSMGVSLAVKIYRTIAMLRCAETACAVERYRLKYGKLPEDLDALVPVFMNKVPIDPFDGKPLRFFRGTFELEYSEPLPDKKKKTESKISPFGDDYYKYKTVTAKKSGYHIYSVDQDLTDDKILKFDGNVYHRTDKGFLVIDKKQ